MLECLDAIAAVVGEELLESFEPLVVLNALIAATVTAWTGAGIAFGVNKPRSRQTTNTNVNIIVEQTMAKKSNEA